MNPLRERLRAEYPSLYLALERSWEVAWEEWFPAVNVNKDSFNSYPHIRNLETYLAKLVVAHEQRKTEKEPLFSALELYVLLSSILLHDIGRTSPGKEHGRRSKELVERHWAHLGIPSYELALTIAKICAFHDVVPAEAPAAMRHLSTVVVDPFGRIRERELAATLFLLDHIDASTLRVVADFIRKDKASIGAFRNKIRGVDIDLDGGLVKVVLGETWPAEKRTSKPRAYVRNSDRDDLWGKRGTPTSKRDPVPNWTLPYGKKAASVLRLRLGKTLPDDLVEKLNALFPASPRMSASLLDRIQSSPATTKGSSLLEALVSAQLLFPELDANTDVSCRLLVAMILGNTRENCEALKPITDVLSSIGLPLVGWCVEHQERLYNWQGDETFEPSLSKPFLESTLRAAWSLTTQIFASNVLSYETLAAELREPNVEKAKRALRRIWLVGRHEEHGLSGGSLWLSGDTWRWNIPGHRPDYCEHREAIEAFHVLSACIRNLGDPSGEDIL